MTMKKNHVVGTGALSTALSVLLAMGALAPTSLAWADEDTSSGDAQETSTDSLPSKNATQVSSTQENVVEENAAQKTQIVYVKAQATGAQEGVYVVNSFESAQNTEVTDIGTYVSVTNLTDTQPLAGEGSVSFDLDNGRFVYQGDLTADVDTPWIVTLDYQLDGKTVSADELSNASGDLEMTLSITPNKVDTCDYADNYLLQITGAFDNALVSSVDAPDATMAQSGDDTQLSYLLFPGQSATYTVKAHVENFEFSGWQMVGVPLSIALDIDDDRFGEATEDLQTLEDAIAEVDEGVLNVADAAVTVQDGIATLASASGSLESGAASFESALSQAQEGASYLSSAVSGQLVPGVETLAVGSAQYASGLATQAETLKASAGGVDVATATATYQTAMQTYTAAFTQAYVAYMTQNPGADAQSAMKAATSATATQQQAVASAVSAVANASAADALSGAAVQYTQIDAGVQSLVDTNSTSSVYALQSGANSLAGGANQLVDGYTTLQNGITSYTNGVDTLACEYASFVDGTRELAAGSSQLSDETRDLDQQMIDKVRDELESFLNPDFTMTDFVNGNSDDIEQVQFVYMTEGIEAEDNKDGSSSADGSVENAVDTQGSEKGFIEKFLALFGL